MATAIPTASLTFTVHLLTGCNLPPPYLLVHLDPYNTKREPLKNINSHRGFWGDAYVLPLASFNPTGTVDEQEDISEAFNFNLMDHLGPLCFKILMRTIAIVHENVSPSSNISWSIAGIRSGDNSELADIRVILKKEGTLDEEGPGLVCKLSQIKVVMAEWYQPEYITSDNNILQLNISLAEQQKRDEAQQAISTKV